MLNTILKSLALDNSAPITYDIEDIDPETARRMLEEMAASKGKILWTDRFPLKFPAARRFEIFHYRNRNSWRRVLNATLKPHERGTRLYGTFEASLFVTIFTILWVLMAFGSATLLLITGWPETIGALLFPIFGIALPHLGRMMTRSDEKAVLALFDETYAGRISHKQIPD